MLKEEPKESNSKIASAVNVTDVKGFLESHEWTTDDPTLLFCVAGSALLRELDRTNQDRLRGIHKLGAGECFWTDARNLAALHCSSCVTYPILLEKNPHENSIEIPI